MANRKADWGNPLLDPKTESKPERKPAPKAQRYQSKTVKPALPPLDVVTADDDEDGDDDE